VHSGTAPWQCSRWGVQHCMSHLRLRLSFPSRADEAGGASGWRQADGAASPDLVESGEVEWGAMPNLDLFFDRVYRCN